MDLTEEKKENEELIAIISAVISAFGSLENTQNEEKFVVRSVTPNSFWKFS